MPLCLLIVDDAPDIAEVVAFGARMAWPDCQIVTATTGAQALDEFAAELPDLVVLDVGLPPPDGFAVLRQIRQTSEVPVLMLTVHNAIIDKIRAFELGADDYLVKPFDHLELMARLRSLVRRARIAHESLTADVVMGDLTLNFANRTVWQAGHEVRLTSTEFRLLAELIRHGGAVLSPRPSSNGSGGRTGLATQTT